MPDDTTQKKRPYSVNFKIMGPLRQEKSGSISVDATSVPAALTLAREQLQRVHSGWYLDYLFV